MGYAVQIVTIVAVLTACGFWFRSYYRTGNLGARALALCLLSLWVAMVLGVRYQEVAAWIGVPSLAQVIIHAAVLSSMLWLQVFTMHLGLPADRVRARTWLGAGVLGACLVALVVLWVLGPLAEGLTAINGETGDRPLALAYLMVFSTALMFGLGGIAWATRYARYVPDRYLRLGLVFIRLGAFGGLLFALHKIVQTIATAAGTPLPWREYEHNVGLSTYVLCISTAFSLIGFMLPSIGPRWERQRAWKKLEPLWSALTTEAPQLVFSPGATVTGNHLANRITEIRDVLIGPLQPYVRSSAADEARRRGLAAGLSGDELDAVVEAAVIAVGLHAMRTDSPAPTTDVFVFASPASPDPAAETRWLSTVATAFASSPVVADVLGRFSEELDDAAR